MKKFIILLPFLLFSYEITNTKIFTAVLKPDTLNVNFTVLINSKDLNKTLNYTKKIISLSKKCPYVDYTFEPLYEFKNNKRKFLGYQSVVLEKCRYKKPKNFENMLNKIKKYGKIRLDAIEYISSKKKTEIKKLKTKAYKYVLKEAKKFSKDLNRTCILKSISFNPYFKKEQNKKFRLMSAYFPVPKEKQEIKVTVFYNINCF